MIPSDQETIIELVSLVVGVIAVLALMHWIRPKAHAWLQSREDRTQKRFAAYGESAGKAIREHLAEQNNTVAFALKDLGTVLTPRLTTLEGLLRTNRHRGKLAPSESNTTVSASDLDGLVRALESFVKQITLFGEAQSTNHDLEKWAGTVDERLRRCETQTQAVASLRVLIERAQEDLRAELTQALAALRTETARTRTEEQTGRPGWPPQWYVQLKEHAAGRQELSGIEALSFVLLHIDKEDQRFRVLAQLLALQLGRRYCTAAASLNRDSQSQILEAINTWLRHIQFPFEVYCPFAGEGFDPDLHDSHNNGADAKVGSALAQVLCWGVRERGLHARVVNRAKVTIKQH